MNSKFYDAEKILRRKVFDGKLFYRIKWLNFENEHNTWEPEENLSCDETLEDFIIKRAKRIIGEYFYCFSLLQLYR